MVYDAIDVASATVLLRAVSNQARLCIVLHLLKGERSVAELEADLDLRQPNLSQQLAELRKSGWLRQDAKPNLCFMTRRQVERIDWLSGWSTALEE